MKNICIFIRSKRSENH